MTDREALALYVRVWPETMPDADTPLDEREKCIAEEVRMMRSAVTLDDAVEVVRWWLGPAPDRDAVRTLRKEVARLRRMRP